VTGSVGALNIYVCLCGEKGIDISLSVYRHGEISLSHQRLHLSLCSIISASVIGIRIGIGAIVGIIEYLMENASVAEQYHGWKTINAWRCCRSA